MSDTYPSGVYPYNSSIPPKWTPAVGVTSSAVQFNGLVYIKSEHWAGGTGQPNEEEVGGIRTWKLYTPAHNYSKGYRYYWQHLHNVIPESGSPMVYDQDAYNDIGNYFQRVSFFGTASENLFPASTASSNLRCPAPVIAGEILNTTGGIFTRWHLGYIPPAYISLLDGLNGYASAPPGSPPITPPTLSPITLVVDKYISCSHPVFVGKTYTGYVRKFEQTASWLANGGGGYDYVLGAITETQLPITHTVTQQDFIDYVEGTTPYPFPTQTFSATGGEDYWVGFGDVVLTTVSPSAND